MTKAYNIGNKTAGSILPTLTLLASIIDKPKPKIKSPPVADICTTTSSVRIDVSPLASNVIEP